MTEKAPAKPRTTKRRVPVWLETIGLVVVALLISLVVKTFFVQMFFVPSGSMKPLFVQNDRILVEKWSYWGENDVERGDVVVFADPGGQWLGPVGEVELNPVQEVLSRIGLYPTGGHLVKRVVGIGGDRVKCCDPKGRVTVNGVALSEGDYLPGGTAPSDRTFDVKVPQDRLWVMGDNRSNSEDSRFHQDLDGAGTIPTDGVVGRVWAIVWPVSRFDLVDTPDTFTDPGLLTSQRKQP